MFDETNNPLCILNIFVVDLEALKNAKEKRSN
jgi:hypothetical protein